MNRLEKPIENSNSIRKIVHVDMDAFYASVEQRPPTSCEEFIALALLLRDRVVTGPEQRFRLVGVGLSNFVLAEHVQPPLFEEYSG